MRRGCVEGGYAEGGLEGGRFGCAWHVCFVPTRSSSARPPPSPARHRVSCRSAAASSRQVKDAATPTAARSPQRWPRRRRHYVPLLTHLRHRPSTATIDRHHCRRRYRCRDLSPRPATNAIRMGCGQQRHGHKRARHEFNPGGAPDRHGCDCFTDEERLFKFILVAAEIYANVLQKHRRRSGAAEKFWRNARWEALGACLRLSAADSSKTISR